MDITLAGVELSEAAFPGLESLLTPEALEFLVNLQREFSPRRQQLLQQRQLRQQAIDQGQAPDFAADTAGIRQGSWEVAPVPAALQRRHVEITGPVDAKMIINALNSGADVFMADFEDATSPSWSNLVQGQLNLQQAVRGTLVHESKGKLYRLNERTATLLVRPRGWHLDERHLRVDGEAVSGSLFDFGLYFFHNARELLDRGMGPYFYLPKLQSHHEAALWNAVFVRAQELLGIPQGSIRATVLIEHILAAFEMEEILWALREHIAGLNAGRWDYIFSVIKTFRTRPDVILPDRSQITMAAPFMQAYCRQLVNVCHRRGAHAIGGMAAFIPSRRDPEVNARALAKVEEDKTRETRLGFDGTWVAHPDLVPVAAAIFARHLGQNPHQKQVLPPSEVSAAELLDFSIAEGQISEAGLRQNLEVTIRYLGAWLCGQGAVAIHNLMEDAATAEISRAQLWQWLKRSVTLSNGLQLSPQLIESCLAQELEGIRGEVGDEAFASGRYAEAAALLRELVLADECPEFLTLRAYELI